MTDNISVIAQTITYQAETLGLDPEAVAPLYPEAHSLIVRAVKLAQKEFGLSKESEWAEDFLSAHTFFKKHGRIF